MELPNKHKRTLTIEQVKAIKAEYKYGVRHYGFAALAKRYKVSVSTIQNIVKGVTWGYV